MSVIAILLSLNGKATLSLSRRLYSRGVHLSCCWWCSGLLGSWLGSSTSQSNDTRVSSWPPRLR